MPAIKAKLEAVVFDIQRASMVDGPGLRTTVFLKGCPLRCSWCHNPEAMRREAQTVRMENGKPKTYGETQSLEQIWTIIEKDRSFYESSGGGLTISGGEPMSQFTFTLALAQRARQAGIHVALDSTGFGNRRQWDQLSPYIDLFLMDYKLSDDGAHRAHTGVSASALHDNVRYLAQKGSRIRLRCPIIPGINDTPKHFAGIHQMASAIANLDGVDLLPYHDTARFKYAQLGLPYHIRAKAPSDADKLIWLEAIQAHGSIKGLRLAS